MAKTVTQKVRQSGKTAETKAELIGAAQQKVDDATAAMNAADARLVAASEKAETGDETAKAEAALALADRDKATADVERYTATLKALQAPAGTISTNTAESESREGGAGNPAGSAPDVLTEIEQLVAAGDLETAEKQLSMIEENFRKAFPCLSDAIDAWKAANGDDLTPRGIRIAAKRDGFRRAGMAHPKAPTDHPLTAFDHNPEQMEALFAEPMLKVELI